jgi:hypothetical protein
VNVAWKYVRTYIYVEYKLIALKWIWIIANNV